MIIITDRISHQVVRTTRDPGVASHYSDKHYSKEVA